MRICCSSFFILVATFVAILGFPSTTDAATDKVFCYYGSWATYRSGNGKFDVESIDPTLCTHVIYSFLGLETTGEVKILNPDVDINKNALNRFVALKAKNPQLKVMVAMGGFNEGSVKYSNVAASPTLRNTMVKSVIAFLQKYQFDGFDLDWEYPALNGGSAADKQNYIALLQLFRQQFSQYGYLLTAAVGVSEYNIANAYDVVGMSQHLDFILLMAYDLRGPWDGVAGHNAPLYASSQENSIFSGLNVNAVILNWISKGAPAQKLVLGVPLYGRGYTLASSGNTQLGAPITGPSAAGPYTGEPGSLSYLEVCEKLQKGVWTTVFDQQQKVPHSVQGTEWIGYDDPTSVQLKAEYAKSKQLGGVMVWSIEQDDHVGVCGKGKFPLLTALRTGLGLGTTTGSTTTSAPSSTSTTTTTTSSTTTSTTTVAPGTTGSFTCVAPGYFRDPVNCNIYYVCQSGLNGSFIKNTMSCPSGQYFDDRYSVCNFSWAVVGC